MASGYQTPGAIPAPARSPGGPLSPTSPSLSAQAQPQSHPVLLTPGAYGGSSESLASTASAFEQQRGGGAYPQALPMQPFPPPAGHAPPYAAPPPAAPSPEPMAFGYSEHTNPLFGGASRGTSPDQPPVAGPAGRLPPRPPPPAAGAPPSRRRMDLENAGSMAHMRLQDSFSFKGSAAAPPGTQPSFAGGGPGAEAGPGGLPPQPQPASFSSLVPAPPGQLAGSRTGSTGAESALPAEGPEAVAFAVPTNRCVRWRCGVLS